MTQNDKRNANMSAMCRLMAKGIESGYSLANVMTFLNESSNSDVKELIALHVELNHRDKFDAFEKACQTDADWLRYTRPLRRNGRRVVVRYPGHYSEAQIQDDFETAFAYLETMDALVLESEIKEYEKVLESERELLESFGIETDNDIAVKVYDEIEKAEYGHQMDIVRIATDAYRSNVKHTTIIRFMREKLTNDEERALFLSTYADAAHSAGLDYHFI